MFNPAQLTLGEIASTLRDLAIVAILLKAAWHSRGLYDDAKAFFKRCTLHMDYVEGSMKTLLENHLVHIEAGVTALAKKKD